MANIVIGEVKLANDQDFDHVKEFCENNDGWDLSYSQDSMKVWIKQSNASSYEIMKISAEFDDLSASELYAMLRDEKYRYEWDKEMIEAYSLCLIDINTDVAYYSMKPPMLTKRDFVLLRSWRDYGEGKPKIVYNYSVNHTKCPPTSDAVRGICYLNSTLIKPTSEKSCILISAAQADIGGMIPAYVVNFTIRFMAPNVIERIHKSALNYVSWKEKNKQQESESTLEKSNTPKIDWQDVRLHPESSSKVKEAVNQNKPNENGMEAIDINI